MQSPVLYVETEDDDGYGVVEVRLPTRFIVCPQCGGRGHHVHPALMVITSDQWAEWDQDERDDYQRGAYDVTCTECRGARVVEEVLEDELTPELRDAWRRQLREEAEYAQLLEAERRYGA